MRYALPIVLFAALAALVVISPHLDPQRHARPATRAHGLVDHPPAAPKARIHVLLIDLRGHPRTPKRPEPGRSPFQVTAGVPVGFDHVLSEHWQRPRRPVACGLHLAHP